ncbi:MAG: hypothetical protein M5U12_19580 [Verrucomicrobia bacterium]|nr:hypothetical protein [Verrucomicrobiota bacterium]
MSSNLPTRAEVGTVLGIVSDLVALSQFGGAIMGRTTVVPAYRLHTWFGCTYGTYGGVRFGSRRRATYNFWTNDYKYNTESWDQATGWTTLNQTMFPLQDVRRHNKRCAMSEDGRFVYNVVEDFALMVWVASVSRSGLFPPDEPYPAFLKAQTTTLSENCAPDPGTSQTTRSYEILLRNTGWTYTKMPVVQRSYAWGFLCWVGKWYQW